MEDDPSRFVEYDTVELEKLRFGVHQVLSPELLMHAEVDVRMDLVTQHIITQVHGYVWSERLEKYTFDYPADWWQAFKERWFSAQMKRKWPVRYTTESVEIRAIYPELSAKVSVPEERHVYRIVQLSGRGEIRGS